MSTKDLSLRGPQDPFTDAGQIGFYYNRIMQELEESKIELDKWRNRILREINLAAEVQQSLLPTISLDKYPVAGINIPLGEISGDFFDYIPIKDKLYFTLGDVSGKGVNAGIVMAKASKIASWKKPKKYQVRAYNRCHKCGRPRAYIRHFGLCRICFREMALQGLLPGIRKASW